MGEIKSAFEIAMEKVAKMEQPTEEERLKWKYAPEGEKLAAKYLKEDFNLTSELSKFEGKSLTVASRAASGVLVRGLALPVDEDAKRINKRAMDGLKMVKNNKVEIENIYSRLRKLFNYFNSESDKQKQMLYQRLVQEMQSQVQEAAKKKYGHAGQAGAVDVERTPEFQAEWRNAQMELDAPYIKALNELKAELLAID